MYLSVSMLCLILPVFIQGVIKIALPNMDREVKETYQVLIQAKDMGGQLGGLAGTTTVNITLNDVNDNPPRFARSMFLITFITHDYHDWESTSHWPLY